MMTGRSQGEDMKKRVIRMDKMAEIEKITVQEEKVLAAALEYIEAGLYVIPIEPNTKMLPPKKYGLSYHHASRRKSTVFNWFKEDGKFCGWNLGIACGKDDGVFAVDVDRHNEVDGFKSLAELESKNEMLIGPTSSTPNGGKHILFAWSENCRSSTSKIGKGIDTRGGDAEYCKSHIVAWPSIVDGKQYEWREGGEILPAPDWITKAVGEKFAMKPTIGSGRGNEEMQQDDFEGVYTRSQIETILEYIQPDELEYEQWLYVGMAIQSQLPEADGLDLWDRWSQNGDRYKNGECTVRWQGFAEEGQVRIGTLIYLAQQGGYDPRRVNIKPLEPMDAECSELEAILRDFNERFAIVVVGGSVRIMSMSDDPDPMAEKFRLHSERDFRLSTANERTVIGGAGGKQKIVLKADIWLAEPERREYKYGLKFKPGFTEPLEGAYNTWDGWAYDAEKGDWSMFHDHIRDVICSGDQGRLEWVLDWMADAVQDPMHPKGTAIIMMGKEGTGKGTFANIFGKLFGRHYKAIQDEEHLVGRFNGHLEQTVLIFADEVTYGGSKKVSGKLKALVTESHLTCERKGVDSTSYKNCAHLLVASNEKWVIPAGPQSRRWFVVELEDNNRNDVAHFKRMRAQMNKGGYEALMHFLMNREIKNNLARAPETEMLDDQRARASLQNPTVDWWRENLELGRVDVVSMEEFGQEEQGWQDRIDRIGAYESYRIWCADRRTKPENTTAFYRHLRDFGCKDIKSSVAGKRRWVFNLPTFKDAVKIFKSSTGVKIQ